MASNKIMSVVFVMVALLCLSSSSSARTISPDEGGVVNVRVLNSMPSNSKPIQVQCKLSTGEYVGQREVGVGAEYRFALDLAKRYTYYCQAYWGLKFAGFESLEPKPTAGDVFWAVKLDGFYLKSADGSKWTREAVWETE